MFTRRSFRRSIALTASAGLAGALAWLPAGPASASVAAQYAAQGGASTSSSCTLTSGVASSTSPVSIFSHGTKSHNVSLDAGFTNGSDSTDTVEVIGQYATTMTIARHNGDLAKVSITGHGNVSIDAAKGSATACAPTGIVDALGEMSFTEGKAGWLYVTRQTVPKQGIALAVVVSAATNNTVAFDAWQGGASKAVGRGFVKPGSYGSELAVGLTAGNLSPVFFKSPPTSSVEMVFYKAGSALSGTSGSGGRFVKFPGSVSCSHHKATLTWKSGASKVASGSFFVNGTKKASDGNPKAGRHVVLRHLSGTADNKITANLSLKGGGHASASRLYVPCKG
jgi:hypothetical protein